MHRKNLGEGWKPCPVSVKPIHQHKKAHELEEFIKNLNKSFIIHFPRIRTNKTIKYKIYIKKSVIFLIKFICIVGLIRNIAQGTPWWIKNIFDHS